MGVAVERWMVIIGHRAPTVLLSDRVYHYWSLNSTKRINLSLHQHGPKIHSSFHSDVEFESVFHLQKMLRRRKFWDKGEKLLMLMGKTYLSMFIGDHDSVIALIVRPCFLSRWKKINSVELRGLCHESTSEMHSRWWSNQPARYLSSA